jgi:hypothetical protein
MNWPPFAPQQQQLAMGIATQQQQQWPCKLKLGDCQLPQFLNNVNYLYVLKLKI